MARKRTPVSITTSKIRVVGYVRVSTEQQADRGSSLEAQTEALRRFAELRGVELVRIEVDAGLSASTLERPALQRALASLDAFEASGIVVVKLDRLTRSVRDFCDLVEAYFKDGQNVLMSVNENVDTSNAMGRMVLNILMSVSQWEREAAAERTAAVKAHLKSTGAYAGGWPPYGHVLMTRAT
jgi:site-specific DNA recombinase